MKKELKGKGKVNDAYKELSSKHNALKDVCKQPLIKYLKLEKPIKLSDLDSLYFERTKFNDELYVDLTREGFKVKIKFDRKMRQIYLSGKIGIQLELVEYLNKKFYEGE